MDLFSCRCSCATTEPYIGLESHSAGNNLKKNSRSVYASAVTAKSNKIIGLVSYDRNLQEVKEKLSHVDNAFQRLREARHDYSSQIMEEDGIAEY